MRLRAAERSPHAARPNFPWSVVLGLGLATSVALAPALALGRPPVTGPAAPPAPALRAEVECGAIPGPGKVLCTVRERPVGGKLTWGDVIVIEAPAFAPPLRTRVAAGDASRSDADGADFALALAAKGDGAGELRVLARAVVCGGSGCLPVRAEATAKVVVGGP